MWVKMMIIVKNDLVTFKVIAVGLFQNALNFSQCLKCFKNDIFSIIFIYYGLSFSKFIYSGEFLKVWNRKCDCIHLSTLLLLLTPLKLFFLKWEGLLYFRRKSKLTVFYRADILLGYRFSSSCNSLILDRFPLALVIY